jgi:hypothetical protein
MTDSYPLSAVMWNDLLIGPPAQAPCSLEVKKWEDYTRPSQDLSWYATHYHVFPWDSLIPFRSCTEFRGLKTLARKKKLFHNLTPEVWASDITSTISLRSSLCHLFISTEKTRARAWEEMRWLWQWYGLFPPKTQSLYPSLTPPENKPFK